MTFEELNLTKPLLNALQDVGYTTPTTIQAKAFSVIMSGKDVLGIAQTGTGKTVAYLLPSIKHWKYDKEKLPQILVLVPTRELVVQVEEEAKKLTKYTNADVVGVFGGVNMKPQAALLKAGADIVVATPGRLLDLVLNGALNLKNVKRLVIDEFDEMLNLGFRPQLIRVLDLLPKKRQNLLFSATVTEDIEELVTTFFNFPVKIEAARTGTPLEKIIQKGYSVPNFNTKVNLLEYILKNDDTMTKVLVFTDTKRLADQLYKNIEKYFPENIGVIHSNKSQHQRFEAVNKFHNGDFRILIATDVIARGIDIAEVSHVINFDTPEVPEDYIHRIGRTGRADKNGNAIIFISKKEKPSQTKIEKLMKMKIPMEKLPAEVEVSKELIIEELPVVKQKVIVVKVPKKEAVGPAFHEKSAKNSKVNNKIRHVDKMKKKYGKPKTRGQKRK
ncbi:MAG: DEAD/DEAH box helicase [Chitinophagales bacterium]|nr:DEAD/DEAH box helicase [Chitinophagales bacterium]